MGCIVNGPGEIADADYGYVGVGKGKINLYKEKTVVKKNVAEDDAVDEYPVRQQHRPADLPRPPTHSTRQPPHPCADHPPPGSA